MHEQVDTLDAFLLGLLGKASQQLSQDRIADVDIVFLGLPYRMVPAEEELLVVLIDISEVADTHALQLLLDLPHLRLAVLVLTLRTHHPKHVQGVEVLLPMG
jgi:hypothetical protein